MNIVFDPTPLYALGSHHPFVIMLYLIKLFGWIPIIFVIVWGLWKVWIFFIQNEYAGKIKFILLAIDVPKDNLQTPKAVEQIFAHLAGAHSTPNFIEKYWDGYVQAWFSLEIISIDGYIQFLLYTPEPFRDLVEAAIYAQYPNAEITEVEDYVNNVPQKYPSEEWNFWGTELILVKPHCYPIRTYAEFEHTGSEEVFKDPMAALLEMMSRMNKGEQVWIQLIINPINQDWAKECDKEVRKLVKEKVPTSGGGGISGGFMGILHSAADAFGEMITGMGGVEATEKKDNDPYNIVMNMTTGDKEIVEGIQKKAAKIGYQTKIRQMYIARHEVFSKQKGVSGIFGTIKQFNTNDKNSIKPELKVVATKINYFFKKWRVAGRQNRLMKAYRVRSLSRGTAHIGILNIEELATLWHFPMSQVKAPLIKKTEVKRVEPPFNLPTEDRYLSRVSSFAKAAEDKKAADGNEIAEQTGAVENSKVKNKIRRENKEDKNNVKKVEENLGKNIARHLEPPGNLPFA
ncbi:MAG: hypothetical protein V1655_01985 [bacterium]